MALLFMDSFDHYVTADLAEKWTIVGTSTAPAIVAAQGRRSSACLRTLYGFGGSAVNGYVQKSLTTTGPTFVVGCAFRTNVAPAAGNSGLLSIWDGSTAQLSLVLHTDLTLGVNRGGVNGTEIARTVSTLTLNTYYYIEWRGLIDNTVGTFDVTVNAVNVLARASQDTQMSVAAQWTALRVGLEHNSGANPGSGQMEFDDLYVLDGSGPAPWADFLGDVRVDVRLPTGVGNSAVWTPLAGANWDAVNDAAPDDDATYTSTNTPGATDTFVFQDVPVTGATIFGIQHCLSVKKLDAGVCTVAPVARHGTTNYPGPSISPGLTYNYGTSIQATNPGTSAQWTEADFNAAEFGYTRVS